MEIATASPELFLRRDGRTVESGPIKGTGRTADDLLEKDHAENVMIVDLVRNDLGRVCATGSVDVPALCAVEKHPGLVHLVSTVRGELADGAGGRSCSPRPSRPARSPAPPSPARCGSSRTLETAPRGPYCGAVGWVDADRGTARARRRHTDVLDRPHRARPRCSASAPAPGITWGSDPEREWAETELKASRLLAVASGAYEETGRTAS